MNDIIVDIAGNNDGQVCQNENLSSGYIFTLNTRYAAMTLALKLKCLPLTVVVDDVNRIRIRRNLIGLNEPKSYTSRFQGELNFSCKIMCRRQGVS